MNDRDKHYMSIAIECDLYDILNEIEKSDREDKESLRKDLINNFIEQYKDSFPSVTEEEFRKNIDTILERTKNNGEHLKKDELDDGER